MNYKIYYITEDNQEQHITDLETSAPLQVNEVIILPDLGGEEALYTVTMVARKLEGKSETLRAFVEPMSTVGVEIETQVNEK